MNEADSTDKSLGAHGATSAIKVREARATLEKMTNRSSVPVRNQPDASRVGWVRRLLTWLRTI